MDDVIFCQIISKEGKIFEGNVSKIGVPGIVGLFTVLKSHAPLVTALNKGEIILKTKGEIKRFAVKNGIFEIHNNKASILI